MTTVKRKLDDLIANKFNVNDVKLDNLDMEMSDDEEDSDLKKKSLSKNRSKSPPYLSTSAAASSSSNGSIRTNLDPRQNRHSHHSHHSNKNKTNSSSSSSSSSKPNQINKRKSYDDDLRIDRDRSNTPVKDEHSPVINKPIPNNTNNPLDFLTKFINKSSTSSESPIQTTAVNASNSSSSANLSYLVDSLKKFVNTSATNNNNNTNYETNSFVPQQTNSQFLYDHPLNNQTSFIQQTPNPIIPQRSATPTKDELYQMPPILPPLPIDTMHNQAPGPTSPYLPQPFHPMMYPPNHPQNQMMYPMYLQAPPPPPPPPMTGIPAPQMPLMMIDPNNCYQYPSTSQSNKMIISPPLSSASTTSSTSSNPIGNQANSPTGQTQYWNASNFNQMETDYDKRASFGNDSIRNDYQSPYKRKFNNYYDNDNDYNKFNNNNNNSGVKQQQHQQSQSFNRIPTINSQRDRGNSFSETNSNNSFNRSNSNNGANNASNSKTNRF